MNVQTKNKVVVLGGSFNPPTIAHERLLAIAINTVDANLGLFVPSSHNYVARKMRKTNKENQTLPEDVRVNMLEVMCNQNKKFKVDTCELGDDGKGHTYDTLVKIQNKYPNADIYFILGYDNIKMLPRWHNNTKLLENFKFIIFSRDGLDVQKEVNKYDRLIQYKNNFIQAENPVGIEDISSTRIRENIALNKEKVKQMMNPEAYNILLKNIHYFVQ